MPTPRPIITPMVEAKSGMETTCDSRPAIIVPLKIPARATPMGRPIASTEPKAMIRMMMAKPMPSASDDGTSNSAKAAPPSSIRRPSTSGMASLIWRPTSAVSSNVASKGASISAKAICPFWEIWRSPPGWYGLVTDCTLSSPATSARNGSMASRTEGSSTPWSAWNTMLPTWPPP